MFYALFATLGMTVESRDEKVCGRDYAFGRLASHSFSLSSALARCDILFFSLLSISAYVWPSYSKHESQPGGIMSSGSFIFF